VPAKHLYQTILFGMARNAGFFGHLMSLFKLYRYDVN
jgi:hypothetical protein